MNYKKKYSDIQRRIMMDKSLLRKGKVDLPGKAAKFAEFQEVWNLIEACREHPIYWWWVKARKSAASHTWTGNLELFFKTEPELVKACIQNNSNERAAVIQLVKELENNDNDDNDNKIYFGEDD